MGEEVAQLLLSRLRARNARESEAVSAVYASHERLFNETSRLERVSQDCRHHVGICVHDLASTIGGVMEEEALDTAEGLGAAHPLNLGLLAALERCKTQLISIQQLIGKRERLVSSDLGGTLRNQRKMISDQRDEMRTAREELAGLYERISSLEEENRLLKGGARTAYG